MYWFHERTRDNTLDSLGPLLTRFIQHKSGFEDSNTRTRLGFLVFRIMCSECFSRRVQKTFFFVYLPLCLEKTNILVLRTKKYKIMHFNILIYLLRGNSMEIMKFTIQMFEFITILTNKICEDLISILIYTITELLVRIKNPTVKWKLYVKIIQIYLYHRK